MAELSPSVIYRLWQQFLTTDLASRGFNQGRPCATMNACDRYLIFAHERIVPQLQMNLDHPSLQAPDGWFQGQPCVEDFTNVVFMLYVQPFVPRSRHATGGNVCSEHVNMSTGCAINEGLLTLRKSPGILKAIIGLFSFGENQELVFIHYTSVKDGSGSDCVWGGISLGGRHVFSRGNVNSYRYDSLDAYVHPYVKTIDNAFMLQDDNARPHRAHIMDAYLEQKTIQRMQWSASSSDLKSIEHFGGTLERRVAAFNPPPRTLATLSTDLVEQ
ncbi:transposable element Tcb1 transposase [Trichonephila clavipes]|uniref:Transposable element Tcb1 transposase n=1 Tax=Trichonephila clavipes TaxID=2585209 RepID=A0A8X6V5P3_TRICX|nr:transposable element Tcb1 transposase [Trichonephila clavipes]